MAGLSVSAVFMTRLAAVREAVAIFIARLSTMGEARATMSTAKAVLTVFITWLTTVSTTVREAVWTILITRAAVATTMRESSLTALIAIPTATLAILIARLTAMREAMLAVLIARLTAVAAATREAMLVVSIPVLATMSTAEAVLTILATILTAMLTILVARLSTMRESRLTIPMPRLSAVGEARMAALLAIARLEGRTAGVARGRMTQGASGAVHAKGARRVAAPAVGAVKGAVVAVAWEPIVLEGPVLLVVALVAVGVASVLLLVPVPALVLVLVRDSCLGVGDGHDDRLGRDLGGRRHRLGVGNGDDNRLGGDDGRAELDDGARVARDLATLGVAELRIPVLIPSRNPELDLWASKRLRVPKDQGNSPSHGQGCPEGQE
ncbi:hypothetical protein B0T25DRAFT_535348 [Lasiosphaeria hispida]|uniref:Uncharacterized protein n=1 Tax=Lasiosphaeria hispida TaxID=260671 RepID=A0AAJ0HSE1_9PEZI|nr:hypothetical protein B0T25DRAFT_535348 [Lasiosphaeria hispida]